MRYACSALLLCLVWLSGCTTGTLPGSQAPGQLALMGSASDAWTAPQAYPRQAIPRQAEPATLRPSELRVRLPINAPCAPIARPTWRGLRVEWCQLIPDSPLPARDPPATAPELSLRSRRLADLRMAFDRFGSPTANETPTSVDLDPLGDAFVGNWEEEHLPPYRFMPLTGSLDLDVFRNGSIYGRAWSLDQDLRGIGVGVAWQLREAWQLAAELGIDPFSTLEEGRLVVLIGVSRTF